MGILNNTVSETQIKLKDRIWLVFYCFNNSVFTCCTISYCYSDVIF